MDLTILEANQNIVAATDFTGALATFSQNVRIEFTPDYVICRGITYTPFAGDALGTYLVYSNLCNGYIGSFNINIPSAGETTSNSTSQNIIHQLKKQVTSDYTFTVHGYNKLPATLNGQLAIHLDFIKLKAVKPQLVY